MRLTLKLWILVFAFLALTPVTALATSKHWKGPGWYMVTDTGFGIMIVGGPYADEAACKADLPQDDNDESCLDLIADFDD